MRRRTHFRPTVADELESRVVLSTISGGNLSPLVSGLRPASRVPGRSVAQPVTTLVNKAFDNFIADYTQARGAYLSTLQTTTDTTSNGSFKAYTRYRVDLLGQEITSSFIQGLSSQGRRSKLSQNVDLAGLVQRNINRVETNTAGMITLKVYRDGTLGRALLDTIPAAGSSSASAALSSLAQDQAIESARVSVLNGFNLAKYSSSKSK